MPRVPQLSVSGATMRPGRTQPLTRGAAAFCPGSRCTWWLCRRLLLSPAEATHRGGPRLGAGCAPLHPRLPSETTTPRHVARPALSVVGPAPAHRPRTWDSSNTVSPTPVATSRLACDISAAPCDGTDSGHSCHCRKSCSTASPHEDKFRLNGLAGLSSAWIQRKVTPEAIPERQLSQRMWQGGCAREVVRGEGLGS